MAERAMKPELGGAEELPEVPNPFQGLEAQADNGRDLGGSLSVGLTTIRQAEIPRALDQLDAIIQGTESAANLILDACAELEAVSERFGGEVSERVGKAVTMIYEACGFQDLAGQRIANVTKTLGLIEGKLSELTSEFGILADDHTDLAALAGTDRGMPSSNLRLDGPQRPENAADQASIDRLFAQIS